MVWLNSNIRCIEILLTGYNIILLLGWIVTLDVLKYVKFVKKLIKAASWIVTLDVLKYRLVTKLIYFLACWIVTLDVLKFFYNDNWFAVFYVE